MTEKQRPAPATLTSLQDQLYGSESSEVKARLHQELTAWQSDLQQAMRSGLTPDDYKRAEVILKGVDAAQKLIADHSQISTD